MYIDLKQWLEVAMLYRKLDRDEEAHGYVMRQVNWLRDSDDYTAAADLLEKELADIDAAIYMLQLGFESSNQRYACFQRLLDTFGRLGRHRETKTFVSETARRLHNMDDACHIAQHMGRTTANYPDRATAQAMGEAVLKLVSDRLLTATNSEADRLAATVALLAPHDRLLLRDSQSYTRGRKSAIKHLPLPPRQEWVREVNAFQLTQQSDHMAGASVGRLLYVAVCNSTSMRIIRCDATGKCDDVIWPPGVIQTSPDFELYPISLHVGQHEKDDVLIAPIRLQWKLKSFPARGNYPHVRCRCWPWLPPFPETLAVCTTAPGVTWTLSQPENSLALNAYSSQGALLQSVNLDLSVIESGIPRTPKLYARGHMTVLAWGDRLILHHKDESPRTIDLGRPILDIVGTAPYTPNRFVVTHDAGATIVWGWGPNQNYSHLAADMLSPTAAFTRNSGLLVLASSGECRVWSTAREDLKLLKIIKWVEPNRRQPVAVLPIDPADDFVVIFQSGEAVHYHVEPPSGGRH